MPNEEIDQVMEAIPLCVEQEFNAWWNEPMTTAGVLTADNEAEAYVAFAAGFEAARQQVATAVGHQPIANR